MNEFYDAYCAYKLLIVKIKHQIFQTAEEMLEATAECIRKQNNLRSMLPKEHYFFMAAEKSFTLKETIDAIEALISQNKDNPVWLQRFLPKDGKFIEMRMELLVKQLSYAGFPFQAVEVLQNLIVKIMKDETMYQGTEVYVKLDRLV